MRWRSLLVTLGLGGAAGLLLWWRLVSVPSSWWMARDDAVITLSHARNLVQSGSIGVSPGDRVEGYSSPLQFLLASVALSIRDTGYRHLTLAITIASVVGMAMLSFVHLRSIARRGSDVTAGIPAMSVIATGLFMIGVVSHWTTIGWVASGMENGPALLVMVAVVASMPLMTSCRWWSYLPSVLVGLLAIARVEFAVFIVPLLMTIAIARHRSNSHLSEQGQPVWGNARRNLADIGAHLAPAIGIVVSVHLARRWYFGSWLPHTATVQERFNGAAQIMVLGVLTIAVCGLVLVVAGGPRLRTTQISWGVSIAALCGLWLTIDGRTAATLGEVADVPGLVLFAAIVGALLIANSRAGITDSLSAAVFISLVFIPLAQFFVMGSARLDPYRVISLALPILMLWSVSLLLSLSSVQTTATRPSQSDEKQGQLRRTRQGVGVVMMWVLAGVVAVSGLRSDPVRVLDFNVGTYTRIVEATHDLRNDRLAPSSLPIVAGPDLGKVTYSKDLLMVDLGWLGDPLMAQLYQTDPGLSFDYLHEIAQPDIVALHHGWSCTLYRGYLESERFMQSYRPSNERWMQQPAFNEDCPFGGRYVIWERVTADDEHALVREIADAPDVIGLIERRLNECGSAGANPLRCQEVRRAVQRSFNLLRDAGLWSEAVAAFRASPTASLDEELLQRDRRWADRAAIDVEVLLGQVGLWNPSDS